jgi:hypothetical protein
LLVTTLLDNPLAGFTAHPRPKTMHPGGMSFFWLICSLWHNVSILTDITIFHKAKICAT